MANTHIFNEFVNNASLIVNDRSTINVPDLLNSLVFDKNRETIWTKGNEYFRPVVAPVDYDYTQDDINDNNSVRFIGPNTTYAMYINPQNQIVIADWNIYKSVKGL